MQPGIDIFGRKIGVRKIAEFRADFPCDAVEDEDGIVQSSGRGLASAIGQMFGQMGFRVGDLREEQEHGWTFNVFTQRRRFWFQITDLGDCVILVSEDMGGPPEGALSHSELLAKLNARLAADARFRDVRWFTPAEYEQQPVERPSIDWSTPLPASWSPRARTENFHLGLLRTLLAIACPFFALPVGLLQVGSAVDAYQAHDPTAATHGWIAGACIFAGTFGTRWLWKQRW